MKKDFIAKFIDSLLTFLASAFFTAAIAGYFLNGLLEIIAVAVAGGLAVTALIGFSRDKKSEKNKPEVKNMLNQFIYNDEKFSLNFFYEALKQKYECRKTDTFIQVKNSALFVDFKPRKLGHTELAEMYAAAKKLNLKKIIVLSYDGFDKEAAAILAQLPDIKIEVFKAEKVFSFLTYLNSIPETKIILIKSPKASFKNFLMLSLNDDRAKSYFFASLMLILSSFIIPYAIYYIIIAAICLALGIISKTGLIKKIYKHDNGITQI